LIQLPFLIAVYRVFIDGLKSQHLNLIYPFISKPEIINPVAFGMIDFSKPNIILAILAGLAQFLQSKLMPKTPNMNTSGGKEEDFSQIMNKQMIYVFPVLTIVICVSLPSGLAFYWILLSLLSVLQQIHLMKKLSKKNLNTDTKIIEGEIIDKK
jgi:YidC/Oxa1 family membrane protein insertase